MNFFHELKLNETILNNLSKNDLTTPSPIQMKCIPHLLKGEDLLGISQTGTGKTLAFLLPLLEKLSQQKKVSSPQTSRALILAPTRELAIQIKDEIEKYAPGLNLTSFAIFGGVNQRPQISALKGGLDILVATPGRLIDLIQQGFCRLSAIEVFILDEGDRMLDMGFIHDLKKIISLLPPIRQNVLFSATMPREIEGVASKILKNPTRVTIAPPATTVEKVKQKVIFCQKGHKYELLTNILTEQSDRLTLIFTRTKRGANQLVEYLKQSHISSLAIHGNKSQSAREHALLSFKQGQIFVLVATDIAARGIDVEEISLVINFDIPVDPESYVHRIGRTARAGKSGEAISFCDESERDGLSKIQKIIQLKLPVEEFVGKKKLNLKPPQSPLSQKQSSTSNNHSPQRPSKKVGFKFRRKNPSH